MSIKNCPMCQAMANAKQTAETYSFIAAGKIRQLEEKINSLTQLNQNGIIIILNGPKYITDKNTWMFDKSFIPQIQL